ncbi:rho GTPase-activating protein 20-like isoform X2 [Hydractinia symbiolongicarpus]|uniref:rho GTPase-activating protein 20-like isoform X2 n=1 Tax=Hydractinia symbiolongicarpus TaxID=13093 RepID=UPI00254E0F56|nr:rho GTPase-activating protein 20-like isoform X2 [Hydractinia symbiolongicarpus]
MKAFIRTHATASLSAARSKTEFIRTEEKNETQKHKPIISRLNFPFKITMSIHPEGTLSVESHELLSVGDEIYHSENEISSPDASPKLILRKVSSEETNTVGNLVTINLHPDDIQAPPLRKRSQTQLETGKIDAKHLLRPKSEYCQSSDQENEDILSTSMDSKSLKKSLKQMKPTYSPKESRKGSLRAAMRSRSKSAGISDDERPHSTGIFQRKGSVQKEKVFRHNSMPAEKGRLNLPDVDLKQAWVPLREALNAISALKGGRFRRRASFEGDEWEMIQKELELLKLEQPDAYFKFKIIQVQEKFPNDKLDLDVSLEEHEKLKHRRYNSPNMRHKKNLSSDIEIERKLNDDTERGGGRASPTSPTLVRRLYIQEGPVKLSSTTSTNERYFILFNDLLLVAKPKSTSNFKLKERVRVSEIWLAHCIDDVTEATVIHDRSFVIGWPTTNYVAAFNSTEEKELWFTALEKSINERREQEEPKAVIIKVYNRTNNDDVCTQQTASFSVTSKEDARSVIKTSLDQFQYQNEDPNDYQLWLSAKDHVPYPLLGHELPYSIKMNYSRSIQEQTHDENDNHYDTTSIIQQGKNCQFVLKKTKKGGNRVNLDIANAQRKWKNPIKKSPIINWAMNKKSVKAPYNQMEMLPPGKLFGNPLTQLSTEENLIPKPIQDILTQLFRKGPSTTGIFRKSALLRTAKQVRQMLDAGKEVDFEEKSAIVLATVLKEFFRSLPDSLIISELYDELSATKSISDTTSRVEQVKRILQNLPQENYDIVMKFMCALHHIQRFSERNNMNSYNLSICVSPSIMWPPVNSKLAVTDQASGSSDVVCFIIDNYVDIFSPENEYVLGAETDIQLDDGHGEDSDSGVDQVIYKSHHPSMDDDDQKNDSEKENEPPTPDFIFTPDTNRLSSAFAQSDSSIGTNDSDETKPVINKVNIPSISLVPEKISVSKSSPTTPILSRRGDALLERNKPNDVKNLSDMSDHEFGDQNEHFQRKLLKQPRNKRLLSSTTTSAELIEHKRHMSEPAPKHNDKKRHDLTKSKNENFQSRGASESAASTRLAKKSVISQPIIQHFATEYYATPNIIFNSVDRRRQPAAPSYEEHIQRTQAKHRVIKSAAVKPPLIAQAQVVQRHQVESYEPLKMLTNNNSATQRDINNASNATSENTLPNQNKKTNSQEDINERFNSIVQTISDSMPVSKCHSTRISSNSPTPSCSSLTSTSSLTSSPMDTSPPRTEVVKSLEEPQMQTVNVETVNVRKVNILPTAPKPDRRKIQKLDLKVVDTSVEHTPVRYTNSLDSSVSDVTSPPISDCVFLSPSSDKENESMATSPKFNSPFSLTLKSEGKKNVESDVSDNRGQSLQLKKTLLTKAPMKLDQLRGSTSREDNGRVVTAREMRRTNRRLKSEIRNAFNEGKFVYKLPSRSETSLQGAIPSRGLRMNINGHLRGENSAVLGTQRNHLSKQTADILGASRIRYTENNNVAESRTCDHDDNKECSPQNESYV